MRIGRAGRRFKEMRSTTAHASTDPNSSTSASGPLTVRCSVAQSFTPVSIGCFTIAPITPEKYAANTSGNTNGMNMIIVSRTQSGGT